MLSARRFAARHAAASHAAGTSNLGRSLWRPVGSWLSGGYRCCAQSALHGTPPSSNATELDGEGDGVVATMQTTGDAHADLEPRTSTAARNKMLRFLRERNYAKVLREYETMVEASESPDLLALNCIIEAKARSEGTAVAHETLQVTECICSHLRAHFPPHCDLRALFYVGIGCTASFASAQFDYVRCIAAPMRARR